MDLKLLVNSCCPLQKDTKDEQGESDTPVSCPDSLITYPDKINIKEKRVYSGSPLKGAVHYGREVKAAGPVTSRISKQREASAHWHARWPPPCYIAQDNPVQGMSLPKIKMSLSTSSYVIKTIPTGRLRSLSFK